MKKQNKKKRKAFGCALLMAALLSVSLGALAQEGLFQRGTPIEHYGNDGSQGLLGRSAAGNPEGNFFHQSFGIDDEGNFVHQTFGVDDEGNFVHQTFGSDAPLGSGWLVLLTAGMGYAAMKRKKQNKTTNKQKKPN